jgi:sigma-B regulation protein RsbQ
MPPHFESRYRTILFDLVGSGQSDLTAYDHKRYGSLHDHAADVIEIIEEFAESPVIFAGHIMSTVQSGFSESRGHTHRDGVVVDRKDGL